MLLLFPTNPIKDTVEFHFTTIYFLRSPRQTWCGAIHGSTLKRKYQFCNHRFEKTNTDCVGKRTKWYVSRHSIKLWRQAWFVWYKFTRKPHWPTDILRSTYAPYDSSGDAYTSSSLFLVQSSRFNRCSYCRPVLT